MGIEFDKERIEHIKTTIVALQAAQLAFANGQQTYTYDSTQGRVTVSRENISSVQRTLQSLHNELTILEGRVYGCGVTRGVPGW